MRWWYHRLTLRHGNCRYMWRSYKTLNLQTARSLHSQVMIMPEPKHYIFIFCDPFSHSTFGVILSLTGNGTWGWYSVSVCAQPLRDIATITIVWYGYIVYLHSTGLILACASMLVSPVCRSISSAKVPDGQQGKTTEATSQKQKCRHFDETFMIGSTKSCQKTTFGGAKWWKLRQNYYISVSLMASQWLVTHKIVV